MKPETLRKAGYCLFGDNWKSPLAHLLGINPRTVRGWMEYPPRSAIPDDIAEDLEPEIEQRHDDTGDVLRELRKILRSRCRN